ncbi:hypothetical protein DPX16_11238 [Anabarilius grahami]|uniref:Uncharacterized protein n=1 Tax=Anabarilius grahami TaxID=495550 RepID=A0A3N0Y2K0_ANAGA|nr:hypothetical protein DPX16_11238 [Anabarilius grahami]
MAPRKARSAMAPSTAGTTLEASYQTTPAHDLQGARPPSLREFCSVPILERLDGTTQREKHEARSQYTLHPSKQEVPKGLAHQRQEAQSANQHPQPTPPTGKYTEISTLPACQ